jgi:glycosyltransferase involved in cell wall biosynthesis
MSIAWPKRRVTSSPSRSPRAPRTLMLGKGWFPEQLGGLDRYYRGLLEQLPEARGVVVGSVPPEAPAVGVSDHDRPLPARIAAVWRASQRLAAETDVVDAHFALYALAPVLFGSLRDKPLVVHFHGPWADENVASGDGSALRHRARTLLERVVYSRADRAVVLTSAFRQVLVERYGMSPWRVDVVPPGVDLHRFTPGSREQARASLELADEAFVAVCVRRLVPRMGIDVLLDAWAECAPDLPPSSRLLIAGEGPLAPHLAKRIAGEPALSASAALLGRVSDAALADLYRAADVCVLPTLEHEGFGLVVLEAAACGTPSVVTRVGGLPEAVAELDKSLIVPPGDATALAERLRRAPQELPSRAAARDHAERHAWESVAERNVEIARNASRTRRFRSRMRVVYLDHVARMSGGEIALLRLLPHLDSIDRHVILAEDGPLVSALHTAGVSTEVLPLGSNARDLRKARVRPADLPLAAAGASAAYVLRLARRLRRLQPDLVHANSLKSGVYGSLAARLAGVPMVWHVRDRIADDYLPPAAVRLVRAMAANLPAAVIANSQTTMATLSKHSPHPVVIGSVLPDALCAEEFSHVRHTRDGLRYAIVGRLAPWKGQDVFLRAFAAAFQGRPKQEAVIIGSALFGEDDFEDELRALAQRLDIADQVRFRGFQPDIWRELTDIDVLVHASVTPEPFGQVVLEGMAAGVPVIATRDGGPGEIIDDGVTGLLYERGNPAELAWTMRRLQHPALREQLSAAAHIAVNRYAPEGIAAELQALYKDLV